MSAAVALQPRAAEHTFTMSRRRFWRLVRYAVVIALALLYVTPLVLTVVSSFKSPAELQNVLSLPSGFYERNYIDRNA